MRIHELTGYKSTDLKGYKDNPHYQIARDTFFQGDLSNTNKRIDHLIQFQKYMHNNGFNPVGAPGQGGTAFEHPNYPWVFKLFTHDQAYMDFLKYARHNQSNPLMPKIKGPTIRINKKTFVVQLEKLYPIQRNDQNNSMLGITASIQGPEDIEFYKQHEPERIEMLKNNYPDMYNIMMELLQKFPNHTLDIHRGNIMQRENGDLVVIDPLV